MGFLKESMTPPVLRTTSPRRGEAKRFRHQTRRAALYWCFLAPSLLIFLLYRIIPVAWNLVLSFQYWSPLGEAEPAGFDHYEDLLQDEVFWQALWNTVIVIGSAPIGIALALMLALLVNADIRGRDVYRTLIFVSYPLMTVAVAIIWRWMFDERVGLINYVARSLELVDRPIPFLNSFTWALPSVIVANTWQMLGFYMIILLTGLQNIPPELHEAAAIDGAGAFHRFRRITLPLLRPSIFLAFVIGMLNSITSFDLVYVMTGGGPGRATEILVTYIYKLGFVQTKFDEAAAVTMVFFVLLLGIAWAANRLAGGNVGATDTE
jgi:ABC-type sugar transport system permease subunit